ncbi:Uncharacterised protein [Listeria grayi]|nr:hypothetical protein [Listeria grayi]STY43773.1 Uncharacterised protein [Listeria grayi]
MGMLIMFLTISYLIINGGMIGLIIFRLFRKGPVWVENAKRTALYSSYIVGLLCCLLEVGNVFNVLFNGLKFRLNIFIYLFWITATFFIVYYVARGFFTASIRTKKRKVRKYKMGKHTFIIGRLIKISAIFFTVIGIVSLYIIAYQVLTSINNEKELYEKLTGYVYNVVLPMLFSLIWLFFNYQIWDIIFLKIRSKIIYVFVCLFAISMLISGFIAFYTKDILLYWLHFIV